MQPANFATRKLLPLTPGIPIYTVPRILTCRPVASPIVVSPIKLPRRTLPCTEGPRALGTIARAFLAPSSLEFSGNLSWDTDFNSICLECTTFLRASAALRVHVLGHMRAYDLLFSLKVCILIYVSFGGFHFWAVQTFSQSSESLHKSLLIVKRPNLYFT